MDDVTKQEAPTTGRRRGSYSNKQEAGGIEFQSLLLALLLLQEHEWKGTPEDGVHPSMIVSDPDARGAHHKKLIMMCTKAA